MASSLPPSPPAEKQPNRRFLTLIVGFLLGLILCGIPLAYWALRPAELPAHPAQPTILPIAASPEPKLTPEMPLIPTQNKTGVTLDDFDKRFDMAAQDLQQARDLTWQMRYAEAIPYWDLVIQKVPELAEAYKLRGICYGELSENQRSFSEYQDYVQRALSDLDQAVALGLRDGDTYLFLNSYYNSLAANQPNRLDVIYYRNIAVDNLRLAVQKGNMDPFSHRILSVDLFFAGQCSEGWDVMARVRAAEGPSAPPSASLLHFEAHGYLCEGKFDQALAAVDAGLEIQRYPEREWVRTIILYNLGRKQEALEQLNEVLRQKPYYSGYRYYLRALLEYELGQKEAAIQDLEYGSGNTWDQDTVRQYVLGRIALDEGRKEEGIERLQRAWETLEGLFYNYSLIPQIERELAELGVEPVSMVSSVKVTVTPMPVEDGPAGMLEPKPVIKNANGIPLPPDPVVVQIETGTGPQNYEYPYYPVFQFQPLQPVEVKYVKQLSIHTLMDDTTQIPFIIFLWRPTTGEWTRFDPQGMETQIDSPEQYVDEQGNIFVAIRVDNNYSMVIENIWPTITVVTQSGDEVRLDLRQ